MTTQELREEIAEQTGIPVAALRGDTREEIQAHADALAAAGIGTTRELTAAEIVDRALGNTSDVADIVDQAIGR